MTASADDYARQAREVLEKQHTRVLQAAEALIQHVGFIRPCDVDPEEWRIFEACKQFVEVRRPARERGSSACAIAAGQ